MLQSSAVRRPSEVKRLTDLLSSKDQELSICCISGPGGVGKTYLLEHVLNSMSPNELGYLTLKVDGSNSQKRGEFFGLIADQMAKRSLGAPAKSSRDYFPHTRRVAQYHRNLVNAVEQHLKKESVDSETKRVIISLLKFGHLCNEFSPIHPGKPVISVLTDEKYAGPVIDQASKVLDALGESKIRLPEPLREIFGLTFNDRIRTDLYALTAEAFAKDAKVALNSKSRPKLSLTQYPIRDLNRLLLIIDDYEALNSVIGDFLIGSLIPRLEEADFQVVIVICCRDDLTSTNPSWSQHLSSKLKADIRLKPFDKESAFALMVESGVPSNLKESIFADTTGFPFLLTLAIEEIMTAEGKSALFLSKFYDRTTRWMSARQKEWFKRVCFLDQVDEDTLSLLFEDELVPDVQDWFEKESSIRDPDSPRFCVRPLIRHKTLAYLEIRTPRMHKEMIEAAQGKAGSNFKRLPPWVAGSGPEGPSHRND